MATSFLQRAVVAAMPMVPEPIIWQFSRRYIAGTKIDDAYATVAALNEIGCKGTIDVLGEDSTNPAQVESARELYFRALDGIAERSLECGISVKLSEMGLRFDRELCGRTMVAILDKASESGNFVRIDMEDSSVTSITLDIYRELRARYDNVGTVIQSCLHRSREDIAQLLESGPTNIRLCKGIYVESGEIAFADADEIRQSFRELLAQLFEGGATGVGIATHDPLLVEHAESVIDSMRVAKDRYEFQMLLGVAERLRAKLVAKGHPMRVYVPFGELWLDYSMRRLRENPQIVSHIARNLLSR